MTTNSDCAQVRLPPPLIFFTFIFLGLGLQWFMPLHFVPQEFSLILAISFSLTSFIIAFVCIWSFKKFHTKISPNKSTTQIVTTGCYRFSRNPIYLGLLILSLGIAFGTDCLWIVILQIPFVIVINKFVICKEEKYLESKFGEAYLTYKQKVRRWL